VPEEDYTIPLGVADVKRPGRDVLIIATSRMNVFALGAAQALAKEGIEAEVIDPRTLKPLDLPTILGSLRRIKRVVIVDEGSRTGGFTAEIAARIMDEGFDFLDAPVQRVAAEDAPIPYCRTLETEAIPQERDIIAAVKRLL
jgi:pyruvate/2-oxoglutarate/acetoin dehydrogenase E1 component